MFLQLCMVQQTAIRNGIGYTQWHTCQTHTILLGAATLVAYSSSRVKSKYFLIASLGREKLGDRIKLYIVRAVLYGKYGEGGREGGRREGGRREGGREGGGREEGGREGPVAAIVRSATHGKVDIPHQDYC